MKINIADRVFLRHPNLKRKEIIQAFDNTLIWKQRKEKHDEFDGLGISDNGKFIEYVYTYSDEALFIYHAQIVSKSVLKELNLFERKHNGWK